jgi:homoserine dehydrogenase
MVSRNNNSIPYVVPPDGAAPPIVVLKFGSSVLNREDGLAAVVQEVYREVREGKKVLAVVSALAGVTDRLLASARQCFEDPQPAPLAGLLSTGESASAAWLEMALEEAGIPAVAADPGRLGLEIQGPLLDADPTDLDVEAVHRLFDEFQVIVLPGFFGRSPCGSPALLGRGGSDLTALFAAQRLGAEECRLLKDVPAIYPHDPDQEPNPRYCYASATWAETLRVGGQITQAKAVEFAQEHELSFTVASPLASYKTHVGHGPIEIQSPIPPSPPLRVVLLGLGTVGGGVYRKLAQQNDRFEVVGIAVRDKSKLRDVQIPDELLVDDPLLLLERPADVVVELIGGEEPAGSLIQAALESGRHVVTGNKAVIAFRGSDLEGKARAAGVQLKYSASVAGSVPAIEQVQAVAKQEAIDRIEGVLNGTCNFILERLGEGLDFDVALREAQEQGFAEADAGLDLSGADTAYELAILARAAFGVDLDPNAIDCRGIEELTPSRVLDAKSRGQAIRLVATCHSTSDGIEARVRPTELSLDHPLAGARGVENRVLIHPRDKKPILLSGKGAGRWPTTAAVLADLLDLYRAEARCRDREEVCS